MENCSTKTEMLREKYKEYLKPIDPLQPLGRDPTDLMPPPDRTVQTCFALKEKFPRGEALLRTSGKRSVLDRLDEYNRLQIPTHCPCENVVQGSDPARKKRRLSSTITKSERYKNEQQHILCSVKNLPQAYSVDESEIPPQTKDIPHQSSTKAKLRTCTTMRDIKKDNDMNQQAINSQREFIRAKAVEIQKKSLALQQMSNLVSKKEEVKKSVVQISAESLGLTSKPTAPRKPSAPAKKERTTISLPFPDMAIPAKQLQNTLAGSSPSSHPLQPTPAIATATSGSAQPPSQAAKNALINAVTSKRTRPCKPVVPARKNQKSPTNPKTSAQGYNMPSLQELEEISKPTTPATSMGNASNENNKIDMDKLFYPDPPQPNVERMNPDGRMMLHNQQECNPTIDVSKDEDFACGNSSKPMSSSVQQANLNMGEHLSSKKSSSCYEPRAIAAKVTPVQPPNSMTKSSSTKTNSLLGISSKYINPKKPVKPLRKPLNNPVLTESLLGIISKPTQPRRPTIPPRKQLPAGIIGLSTKRPEKTQNHPQNSMPDLV